MSRARSSKSSRNGGWAGTMREIVDEVHRGVDPLEKYARMVPGDFDGEDMQLLRHASGELLHLAEWDIELDDARNIVRSGADVYVNPEDYSLFGVWPEGEGDQQQWLLGPMAALLHEAVPLVGKNYAWIRISLYTSENGLVTVHVTGDFAWPESFPTSRGIGRVRR